ncbi:response regulator [uncultured Desulfobacter sp.]|uniref:response regulator n=1 Tax=uncultured Desulfobacter sp. TaxID=240139 RepID=UPI002AAC3BFF|nr:response regulator [uncultured Desulfobacter sp.]
MEQAKKTSIFILDDEPIVCKRLKASLDRKGYEVITSCDSTKALEIVRQTPFDIVITDLKMEGIDGMQFFTEVKKLHPDTQVIVITGFATLETAKESFKRGVFDFLAKPFKLGEIFAVIERAENNIK